MPSGKGIDDAANKTNKITFHTMVFMLISRISHILHTMMIPLLTLNK